jgi:hypothetical protein
MRIQGFVDVCDADSIAGWAWDSDAATQTVYVNIYDNGALLARVSAGDYREDLRDSSIGDGRHAFEFHVPTICRDGRSHHISVRALNHGNEEHELSGSPQHLYWEPNVSLRSSLLKTLSGRYVMDPKIWTQKWPFLRWSAALKMKESQCPERVRITRA